MNLVYEHDATGQIVYGNLQDLADQVAMGYRIAFSFEIGGIIHVKHPQHLWVDNGGNVYAEVPLRQINFGINKGVVNFQWQQNEGIAVFCTTGVEYYRISSGSGIGTNTFAMKWFVE